MTDYEITPNDRLRIAVESTILRHLREHDGPEAVTQRLVTPGYTITEPTPTDWQQGIATARIASEMARTKMLGWTRNARGEGMSWEALAEPLGIKPDPDPYATRPGEAAFELAAGVDRRDRGWSTPAVNWHCSTCAGWIKDRGPMDGLGVDERETGHAEGCSRHEAEIAAERARWDDE